MFGNRAFQVSMVKKDQSGSISPSSVETQADLMAFASDATKDVMHEGLKCVVIGIASYKAMDTISKVIITLVNNK